MNIQGNRCGVVLVGGWGQIPVDMVVNAMMAAMAAHLEEQAHVIYHVTSSLRNPTTYTNLKESFQRYFFDNPLCNGRNAKRVQLKKMRFIGRVAWLRLYITIKYKLPLQVN